MIKIIENFITEEEAIFFIDYIDTNKDNKEKFPLTRGEYKGKVRSEANIPETVDLKEHEEALGMIKVVSDKALSQFNSMSKDKDLVICAFWMAMLGPTTKIPMHKDDIEFAEHLNFSCVVYLNDNYSGGSIIFRDENFRYKPKKLSAIFFPSNYYHEVERIEDGRRMTLPIWASSDKNRDMFIENPIAVHPLKIAGVSEEDPSFEYLMNRYERGHNERS
jgi:hypothetical protein